MKVEKLKQVGKDVEVTKTKSNIQAIILATLKQNTKNGDSLTQKEVADIVGKKLEKKIAPQHARSALLSLRKKGKVKRIVMPQPDETGNTHFWYAL